MEVMNGKENLFCQSCQEEVTPTIYRKSNQQTAWCPQCDRFIKNIPKEKNKKKKRKKQHNLKPEDFGIDRCQMCRRPIEILKLFGQHLQAHRIVPEVEDPDSEYIPENILWLCAGGPHGCHDIFTWRWRQGNQERKVYEIYNLLKNHIERISPNEFDAENYEQLISEATEILGI